MQEINKVTTKSCMLCLKQWRMETNSGWGKNSSRSAVLLVLWRCIKYTRKINTGFALLTKWLFLVLSFFSHEIVEIHKNHEWP